MVSASLEPFALWIGAVAYDPKVVTIWEGMRRYFVEDAKLPVEVVLFQSYEAQVASLLAKPGDGPPCIDIAWNTNLAFVQADRWSSGACNPIAMRDTDIGWMTKISGRAWWPCANARRSARPHARARQPRFRPRCDPAAFFPRARGPTGRHRFSLAPVQQRCRQTW